LEDLLKRLEDTELRMRERERENKQLRKENEQRRALAMRAFASLREGGQ
jgi:hypothetical protein